MKEFGAEMTIEPLSDEEIMNMLRQQFSVEYRILGCVNKVKFNLATAKRKAKIYGQYYYKCCSCGCYHLTKQPTIESIKDEVLKDE